MEARENIDHELDLKLSGLFDRRWRVGKYVVVLIQSAMCVAALAGIPGSGASSREAPLKAGALKDVKYERIVRNHGSNRLLVDVREGTSGPISVHLERSLLDAASVDSVVPTPSAEVATLDGVTYEFDANRARGTSFEFKLAPFRSGVVKTTVTAGNIPTALTQIVLP